MHATSSCSDVIVISAGEQSGDNHAAELMKALKAQRPGVRFVGMGGPRMQAEGLQCLVDPPQIMGFVEVLRHFPTLLRTWTTLRKAIATYQPIAVITVDFQDFHLQLAKKTPKTCPWIHYISPAVWAWRPKRARTLARLFDKILCIFPFEPSYYPEKKAVFVGNPTAWQVQSQQEIRPFVAIFPGSRPHVVRAALPEQLKAARLLGSPVISVANAACKAICDTLAPGVAQFSDDHRCFSKAIATCGTIVLELALAGTPTVCTYAVSPWNYFLGKWVFRIRKQFFCLPNILLQREIIPECIGPDCTSEKIFCQSNFENAAKELCKILLPEYKSPSVCAAREVLALCSDGSSSS